MVLGAQKAAIVQTRGLCKVVQNGGSSLTVLEDIDFDVREGEAVAILGPSGSGKSTLLGLMAGLDCPSAGRVWLDGIDITALDEDDRAKLRGRLLGFVFQSFQLLPAFTALENVMLPLELMGAAKAEDEARRMLERVGLGARLNHYPRHLSGGEQQRVALARAFVRRPRLLLADEPTGNLDAATAEAVIDLMFELNAAAGTTLILVTHDADLARRCGRHVRLVAGRISPLKPRTRCKRLSR